MSRGAYLGDLELLILLAVIHLRDEAYGVPIAAYIEAQRERPVSLPSVYAVLERLADRRLVTSRLGEPTAERGGRSRRYFNVTEDGLRTIHETRRILTGMWKRLPALRNPALKEERA